MDSAINGYDEPPYRRTEWTLHRRDGRLVLEERVLAADEITGLFSRLVRQRWTAVDDMDEDFPPAYKFEEKGRALHDGQTLELSPADEYWDDEDDPAGDALDPELDESEIVRLAGAQVAEQVIPRLAEALYDAALALADRGVDVEIAGGYALEALARYLTQDASLAASALVDIDKLDAESAQRWLDDNLSDS
jgi:hypothetical protein